MNENYQQLYGYLSQNGLTDLSSDEFYNSYSSNKANFNQLYAYLAENKMTDLGADDFYAAYFEPPAGAKKKSQSSPSYTPPSRGYLPGDELVRQIAEAPSEPVYPNVRRAQVVRQMLENTTLLDVDQNVLQSYGLDESDWRTAQVAYALDNTEQDVQVASQAIQDRSYEQALAEAKAKAQEAFIPQLLKDTFPNSPNLFRAAEWLFEPQYGPMGNSTANFMLDLIDSSVRAVAGGLTTNDAATEAFNVFNEKGVGLSRESTDRLYNAVVAAQGFQERYGQSESMLEWSAEIEEAKRNGDSELLAALFATAKNPMVLPEIMVNSYASVFNKASIAAAATTTGGFIAGGAGAGAVGGPAGAAGGALVGAASSVPWAMGAAFTALEVGMTFPELVRAEMEERGMEFNKENFYAALNNDEIYNSALARSAARGAAIGVVSALGARAATQVSKNLANRGMSSVGRTFSVAPIEMGAGFSGEVLGQAAGGQEIDLAEATMEGLAEIGMAPIAVAGAYAEDLAAKKPKYKVGTNTVGREEIERVVTAATPEELKQMSLTVENDSEMEALIDDKMFRSEIADRVPETLDSEARRRIINLEAEKRQIQNRKTDSFTGTEGAMAIAGKERIAQIDEEIYDIMNPAPAPEPLQPITLNIEPTPEPEIVVEPAPTLEPVFVADLVNRPVTLTSHNGTPLETPVQGDLYVDGQTVVVESADRIYEIGNVSELSEQDSRALGIEPQVETVVVQADESLVIENEEFLIQRDLPTMGIDYDADGNVTRVSLESKKDGSKKMFSGQTAIDAAYQILLSKAESPEQIDRVDQILEQDEEYKRLHDEYVAKKLEEREDKPREVAAAPQARPDTDTRPSAKPSESKPVAKSEPKRTSPLKEKEAPQPKPANKVVDRLTRLLSIETDPVRMSSLVAQLEQAAAMGVALPEKSAKELREAKEQLEAGGYVSETPQVGSDYDPNTTDEVVMVTSTELPAGQKKVVSVTRPRVTQNGRVKQPAKLVVAVGTADPTALSTGRARGELQTLSNPRTQKQLQTTYEKLWGMTPEKAKAAAAISDKMIGTMAARHGISKKDMYARIKWVKSSSVDANGNSVPGTDGPVVRFQSTVRDAERGITQEFFAGGDGLEQLKQSGNFDDNAPLSTIYGKSGVVLHIPDKAGAFSLSKDGKTLVELQGGIFFPLLPGFFENRYFWASTENAANTLTRTLNKAAVESNDGKVRLVLVSTNLDKVASSSSANTGLVRLLESFMNEKRFPLSKSVVKAALLYAVKETSRLKKPLNANVNGSMNVNQIIETVLEVLSPTNSTFDSRKIFFESVAGSLSENLKGDEKARMAMIDLLYIISGLDKWKPKTAKGNPLAKRDILIALHSAFSEPILRNVGNSLDTDTKLGTNNERVYAVIEADVNPSDPANTFEAISPKKEGLPEHASYPRTIRLVNQDARTTVRVLNERVPWYNLVINPSTGRLTGSGVDYQAMVEGELITKTYSERNRLLPTNSGLSSTVSTISISADPTDVNLIPLNLIPIQEKAIVDNTKKEVDRIKSLNVEAEDGVTFNNDGTVAYVPKGDTIPVVSFNTTQEELTSNMISEFVASVKEAFSTMDVKFGLYKFSNSNKVSIDVNIIVDEDKVDDSIKFAKYAGQESIFRMSDFSLIKTGATGKDPKRFTMSQFAEIAKRLQDGTIDTFIKTYDKTDENGFASSSNVLHQDERAAIVMSGTEAVIHAISNPDVTSPLHELAHLYEQVLTDEERQQILDWTGQEEWDVDTSEAFAEGFEKFLYEGEAPTPEMKSAFSKFKKWITEIYSAIKGTPLQRELNDNMRRIYENIFATQEPENITHNQQPINGVLYQGPTNAQGQSTYSPSNMSSFQTYLLAFRRKWQDKYAEVMWFQDDIKKQGKKVTESADFRMAEDLMHGRTRNDMDKVEQQLDEAQKFMRKHGITSDDLSDYLYALHAPSRNQSILDKYGKVDGSGMSDAEADAILNDLRAKYDPDILEQAADYFRNMLANNRQIMSEFGLETAAILDDFEQNETYVPLFGVATDEMSTDTTVYPTGGAGIHVYGHVSKKAKGRKSRATNVLANIVSASLALRIKARKNESLLSLYNLIQDNPSDAWEVVSDSDTGDEASVGVRINGEQHFIRFADPNKAKQLKNMGIDSVNWFNKALRVLPTSWLRKSYTVYDPDFVMSNFWRDIEAAILNAAAEAEEGGITEGVDLSNDMAKVKKNVWPTFKALLKINFGGNADPAINQYYEEMKEDGGITGWVQLKTLGDMAADIQSGIDPSGLRISKDKLGAVFTYVEKINDSVEQAIRLTAYIVARERGISRNKAAQLAKNITVNFNRYGEHGITLNQFKMFFNASIQGSYRILTTLGKTRKGTGPFYTRLTKSQKLAFGLFLMNSTVTAFNIAMSDDDEDDVSFYKKMSDNDKQRNMILMYDGKHSIKIPVTFGYSAITSFAEAVTSTAMGVRDADDACWFTLSSLLNSFSPVQFGDYTTIEKSIATLITPSGLAAVTESALNETFMGSQVYREQLPFGTPAPEYQLGFKSPMWLRDATKAINEMTGGSEYVPGDIDINPDRIYHYYNFYIGGLGRFVGRSGEAILSTKEMIQSGRTVRMSANDLPLLRKMYGEPSRFYDYKLFTENLTESKQLLDEYEDPATRSSDKDRYGKIYTIKQARLATEKKLKDLRAQLRQAEKIEDYVERKNTVFELYEKQRLIMAEFNKLYNEKGPKKD